MGVAAVVIIAQARVAEQGVRAGPVQVEFLRSSGHAKFVVAVPCGHAAVLAFQSDDTALCITEIKEGLKAYPLPAVTPLAPVAGSLVALIPADQIAHADPLFTGSVYIGLPPALSSGSSYHSPDSFGTGWGQKNDLEELIPPRSNLLLYLLC
ncbi:hypothetical protein D3C76_799150 [compost metagenome]